MKYIAFLKPNLWNVFYTILIAGLFLQYGSDILEFFHVSIAFDPFALMYIAALSGAFPHQTTNLTENLSYYGFILAFNGVTYTLVFYVVISAIVALIRKKPPTNLWC